MNDFRDRPDVQFDPRDGSFLSGGVLIPVPVRAVVNRVHRPPGDLSRDVETRAAGLLIGHHAKIQRGHKDHLDAEPPSFDRTAAMASLEALSEAAMPAATALLNHAFWDRLTPLEIGLPIADNRLRCAMTVDLLVQFHASGGFGVLMFHTSALTGTAEVAAAAEIGAAVTLCSDHYRVLIEKAVVVTALPDQTVLHVLPVDGCTTEWIDTLHTYTHITRTA